MLKRTESLSEFLARGGQVTRCAAEAVPAHDAPKKRMPRAPRKESTERAAARPSEHFDIADYRDVIVRVATKVCNGHHSTSDIAANAVTHVLNAVTAGKFRGGDAKPWASMVAANFARDELRKANHREVDELNMTGERSDDAPVDVPANAQSFVRLDASIEAARVLAVIANLPADRRTYIETRLETGSNNEACEAAGYGSVSKGTRVWQEFVELAREVVG